MTAFVALLRAVNVGGTGKLPMSTLRTLCHEAGLTNVRTYIASGNVVFDSALDEAQIKMLIEARLAAYAGRKVDVLVRTAVEMVAIVADNPFAGRPGNRTVAIFLDRPPASDAIAHAIGRNGEELILGRREIYVFYGDGMADSKLRIPAARSGTARNMNTVGKLATMAVE